MRLELTHDAELVRRVLTHPDVYPMCGDDATPPPDQFQVCQHPAVHHLAVLDDEDVLGCFCLAERGAACWEVHSSLLPRARTLGCTMTAVRLMLAWVWEHSHCNRVVCSIPAYNRPAIVWAAEAGFRMFGRNPGSVLKYGKLHDQVLFGITRPEKEAHG